MIAYVHTAGDYGMNVSNFGILMKICLYFTVNGTVKINQVENGQYNSITPVNDLRALFPRSKFPYLELFRYLQAVVFVSNDK